MSLKPEFCWLNWLKDRVPSNGAFKWKYGVDG